ncbi:MAG: rod-binding protein [Sphingobium sp.]
MPDPLSPTSPLPPTPPPAAPNAQARKAAKDFEAVFIGQMTKLMMESVEQDSAFSGGHGEEMFRGVLAEKLGEAVTRKGGIGLADAVLAEIVRLQAGEVK